LRNGQALSSIGSDQYLGVCRFAKVAGAAPVFVGRRVIDGKAGFLQGSGHANVDLEVSSFLFAGDAISRFGMSSSCRLVIEGSLGKACT
jgi:hypothetical protein